MDSEGRAVSMRASIMAALLATTLLTPPACGQAARPAPLGDYSAVMQTLNALQDADATKQRALAHDAERNFFPEVQDYEEFIARWENTPPNLMNYSVLLALAGAHLEAARSRALYGANTPEVKGTPRLREDNQARMNSHIERVYGYVVKAAESARSVGIRKEQFACGAYKLLATAVSLHGIVNQSVPELDKGILQYERTLACDPENAAATKGTISQLKHTRRNMGSILTDDFIADAGSKLFKEFVPKYGSVIGFVIDQGYEWYKARESSPIEALPNR